MYITVLLIHIAFAAATIAASFFAIYRAGTARAAKAVMRTWQSFAATAVSGIGLVAIAPYTLGHFCVLASAYVVGIVLVQLYVRTKDKALAI